MADVASFVEVDMGSVETGFGGGLNAITAGRVDGIWLPLLPEVLKHPIFGTGHSSILWSEAMRNGGGR